MVRWSLPRLGRRLPAAAEPDPAWRRIIADHLAAWDELDADERSRLEHLSARFVADKHWEAARGFELSETVKVVIAASAGLLVLGLDPTALDAVHTVIVHGTAQTQRGERSLGPAGVRTDRPRRIQGRTGPNQPIVVSWDAVRRDGQNPDRGCNVVHHELAHHLDGRDGTLDGTPLLPVEHRERWVEVTTAHYEDVRSGAASLLRPYAAESPAEFFAVATEAFLARPVELEERHRPLYDLLRDFYRQDPAQRRRRRAGGTEGAHGGGAPPG